MSCYVRNNDESISLKVYVQPRASKNEIAGLHNGALKLRLTTPPVDGKANKAVLAFLAKVLGLPKSSLTLKSGHQNRNKVVVLTHCPEDKLTALLSALEESP